MTKYMEMIDIEFDLIYYQTIGKKRHYLTNNIYYAGVSHNIRKRIVDEMKLYISTIIRKNIQETQKIKNFINDFKCNNYRCGLALTFVTKTSNWELDNSGSFWIKIICDVLKEMLGKDDTVKFIHHIDFRWHERKDQWIKANLDIEDYFILTIYKTEEVNENND